MSSMKDRVIDFRRVPAGDLQPHPKNWRAHPKNQRSALRGLLDEVGFAGAVLARQTHDGKLVLIDGHLRKELLPTEEVPALITDLTEAEAEKVLATFDPIGAMANRDDEALKALLAEVSSNDASLGALLEKLGKEPAPGLAEPDEPAGPIQASGISVGDLFELGSHRLLCGDSTKDEDVRRLMDGYRASLMATDPPYLVNYDAGNHPQSWANREETKDKKWDEYVDPKTGQTFFEAFLRVALAEALTDSPAIYQWHASRRQSLVEAAWVANGLLVHQQIIWAKEHAILTYSHFMWGHEPCFYGWREGHVPRKPPANLTTVCAPEPISYDDAMAAIGHRKTWFEESRIEEGLKADAKGLRTYLEGKVLPFVSQRILEVESRPLILQQAFGESFDAKNIEHLRRIEAYLDRKFATTLDRLLHLRQLRLAKAS